ncbi:cytochrome P450 [Karstenula rhodostoma CBS 690.94]|uniref:Cytochrome P450 n=1 Tax=Karstenula rhodostoma CBS 690.94 TaxID=1392251 RepID=A0A9P4U6J5_9PLEO|nr:cytochrome P450 [Karstenula rhodostoma CBS 690.94]
MAENTKPFMPGSGVCPGQTTGRGILDDAVSLIRGDRFLSYDFNSNTLTHWGAAKLQEPAAGSYRGVLSKLIFNALPGAFSGTSSYALLPFYRPDAAREILKGNNVLHLYELSRPPSDPVRNITGGNEFLVGWDGPKRHVPRSKSLQKLFFDENYKKTAAAFFSTSFQKLIEKNSLAKVKSRRSLDVVRDVTNIAPVLWLAERFAIPLKTAENPRGVLSIYETLTVYITLFLYQNFNIRLAEEWRLRETTMKAAEPLRNIFQTHLKTQSGAVEHLVDWLAKGSAFEVGPHAGRLYHGLRDTKLPIEELFADCIGIGTPIVGHLTQQASLLIDLYLRSEYEESRKRIIQLAQMNNSASQQELQGFVFEGMRHANSIPGLSRVTARDVTIVDGARGSIFIVAGQTVLIATSVATMDPVAFPEPGKIDLHRPFKDYSTIFGSGLHYCFGQQLASARLATMLREVFKLKNVRCVPGKQGVLIIFEHSVAGVKMKKYLDASSREAEIPTSLTLHYDG